MNKFEEELEKIKVEKEVLTTLPINNIRNVNSSYKRFEDSYNEFLEKNSLIIKEIERRFNKLNNIEKDLEINNIEEKILNIEEDMYILNDISTSYEKMGLDVNIHNLKYYYMKDLTLINENISDCISKFKKVGINISQDDFSFNKYVNEYLEMFFEEKYIPNTLKTNEIFEKIYWKCPEIINYIELNIRHIYLINEKKIDKYYQEKKEAILKSNPNIYEDYTKLKKDLIYRKITDKNTLINNFIDGSINFKDYTKEKNSSSLSGFVPQDILEKLDDDKIEDLNLEMLKFTSTLKEYKLYLKYKFIIDIINNVYQKKDKNKKIYEKLKKEINKKEKKILSINKKRIFSKSEDENLAKQTSIVLETKELYEQLDKSKVNYKIETKINENSTLFDVLYLASCFYDYMFNCVDETNKGIEQDEIKEIVNDLRSLIKEPTYNILNNITINENKNILYIIKDKYQLSNITITKEELDENNLDNLITSLKKFEIYYSIMKNKIDLNLVSDLYEFNKILKSIKK